MIHVRFDGRSYDFDERSLDITSGRNPGDREILARIARRLDISIERLDSHVVDRRPGGEIVVRPEAVYG